MNATPNADLIARFVADHPGRAYPEEAIDAAKQFLEENPGVAKRIIGKAMKKQGERWRPYRTMACWYLWRSLDPVEINY